MEINASIYEKLDKFYLMHSNYLGLSISSLLRGEKIMQKTTFKNLHFLKIFDIAVAQSVNSGLFSPHNASNELSICTSYAHS